MPINTLTPVSAWPTRRLPQATFDASVRISMNQMSTMVSQLNSGVIPGINAASDTAVSSAATAATAATTATTKAGEAAASATSVAAAATTATTKAGEASTSATNAANSATAAASSATDAAASATSAADSAAAASAISGLPTFTSGDSGKAIVVKPDASGWELAASDAGWSVKQTISNNLALTVDSPRKMVLDATVPGLKVIMPFAPTLKQDGLSFIIANYGAYPIQVVDHDNHTLGSDLGSIPANSARGFVLVDKAAGTWAILNLVSSSVGGRIGEVGFILDTHQPVVFESAATAYISAVSLSDTKVLVAYRDNGNSPFGTAIVLTINGTGITVGTPVVFESASTSYISAVSLSDTKVLVAYRDNGNSSFGTAIVLTINGTGITLGTPVVFESAGTIYISAVKLSDTKVLVAYSDNGNSSFGTAIVLTINGTGITVGTPVVFESATTTYISAVPLSDTKVLVAYSDNGNSSYGTAIVLNIDGTSISPGDAYPFCAASTSYISAVKLSDLSIFVAYQDGGNGSYGTSQIITRR